MPDFESDFDELDELLEEDDEPTPGVCRECGCTEDDPCPGGCIWATPAADLCSRCAREQ